MHLTALRTELRELRLRNFLALTMAGMVNAFGVTVFLAPVKLYDSGISGTSMLLSQVTPLSLSVFLVLLNVPLFLYGLKRQGLPFTLYAIYSVLVYSVCAWLITDVLPLTSALPRRWRGRTCCSAPCSGASSRAWAPVWPSASAAPWTASRSWP